MGSGSSKAGSGSSGPAHTMPLVKGLYMYGGVGCGKTVSYLFRPEGLCTPTGFQPFFYIKLLMALNSMTYN